MWFDISRPLRELRGDLEKKLKTNLESYRLCLQDKENLNNNTVLEEGEERVVQVSIEITRESSGRVGKINIVDVKEMVPDSDTEAEESEETVTPKEVQVRDVENVGTEPQPATPTAVTPESLRPPPTSPFIPPRKPNPIRKLMFDIFDEDDTITPTSPASTASPASPTLPTRRGSKRHRTPSPVLSPPSSPPSSTSWKMKIRLPRNGEDHYTILENVRVIFHFHFLYFSCAELTYGHSTCHSQVQAS